MPDPSITICGALGDDPTLRYTAAGKPVCSGRVAHICADLSQIDPRYFLPSDILWASPE
ncbi:hypothetical protein [Gordonia sp. FQ]|uniref:hypothetical protein n=1 Tax=Gordonia sp. FQ TaxID=3446634 RepID=UPI003F82ADD1